MPARPYKPKDKAKAEAGVLLVERWIMAKLRHQTFFSLAELNQCISALLTELNQKPFKQMPGSRQQWFERWINQPCHSYRSTLTSTRTSKPPALISIIT